MVTSFNYWFRAELSIRKLLESLDARLEAISEQLGGAEIDRSRLDDPGPELGCRSPVSPSV